MTCRSHLPQNRLAGSTARRGGACVGVLVVPLLASSLASPALAGRPQTTDDAATLPEGNCQFEAWTDRSGASRATVLAPACALNGALELDLSLALPASEQLLPAQTDLAVKWVPPWGHLGPADAGIDLGLKAQASWRHQHAGWQGTGAAVSVLATAPLGEAWRLHANLGVLKDREAVPAARQVAVALAWTPHPRWLVFAEHLANDRPSHYGAAQNAVGLRHWYRPEVLGVDLTAARVAGESTRWSLGFGWYGWGWR